MEMNSRIHAGFVILFLRIKHGIMTWILKWTTNEIKRKLQPIII